jgi:DNA-binding transcriptional LysR family regulator
MAGTDHRLFAAIVAGGSLSAAGRALGMSAPMVSKRLARLEDRLGSQLVRRTTRRLELTDAGLRFHADVVAILAAVDEAEARVGGRMRQPAGTLRLSAPTSFGRMHVAPLVARFIAAHPRVSVTLDLSDGFVDLIGERIDLAVRIAAGAGEGLVAERLTDSRRVLCAAPAYLAAHGTPAAIAALADHRLLAAHGQLPWRLVAPGGRAVTVTGRSIVATNSSEVVRELALAGAGLALRSLWDVAPSLASGALVRVLPDHEGSADVGIFAVRPRGDRVPAAVTAFTDLLRAAFSPVPPWARPSP